MTFAEWQRLEPKAASTELLRRVEAGLAPAQRKAVLAVLRDEKALTSAFSGATPFGALRGVPYLIKDLFDVRGLPTFAGSSFLPEVRQAPVLDSRIVHDLEAAGAVLAGKTHLFEFAWGLTGENIHYGDCERPGSPGRTSGGSSSGSAAAVAAGIVPLAIGTDTGGSVRLPAAFCGIYGYRGIPGDPWIADAVPLAPSFDAVGWFTRTARDMGAAIDALVGLRPGLSPPRGWYLEMPGLDPEVAFACRDAAKVLAVPAHGPLRRELASAFEPAAEVYGVLAGAESWKIHRKWAEKYWDRYGPIVQDRLERVRSISQAQIAAVKPSFETLKLAWSKFFGSHDFLVMPAAPSAAFGPTELTLANRMRALGLTAPASLAGLPCLALPLTLRSGLSTALQVVVRHPQSPAIPWILETWYQSSA